jgi:hypothetical protein
LAGRRPPDSLVRRWVVSLVQFLRVRDRRLLLVATMFACRQALSREWYDVCRDVFQAGVCGAGLALMLMLSRRPVHEPAPGVQGAALAPEPATPDALPKD